MQTGDHTEEMEIVVISGLLRVLLSIRCPEETRCVMGVSLFDLLKLVIKSRSTEPTYRTLAGEFGRCKKLQMVRSTIIQRSSHLSHMWGDR